VEIVGLDLSPHMLAVCRQRLDGESRAVQSKVHLVQADMRQFSLSQTFKLATVPFRPFQHLTTIAGQLSCLECIRRHLADDGVLILDLFNPSLDALVNRPIGEELDEEPEFSTPDGRRIVRRHKTVAHDRFNQVSQFELVYYIRHPGGREERLTHSFALRYLFRFEAEHLFARAGFEVEHVYSGFDKSPYGAQYPGELIFVARKARASMPAISRQGVSRQEEGWPHAEGPDAKRAVLRHFLGALAYRTQKALRGAPPAFALFDPGHGVRPPKELIRHMTSVLGYANTFFVGGVYRPGSLETMDQEVARFHDMLAQLAAHLANGIPLLGVTEEQLLQGPFADAMTHGGQLALLRRLAGAPVPPENFVFAEIRRERLGPDQAEPVSPDAEWPDRLP
jgi:SAM-dependent methyltransferase